MKRFLVFATLLMILIVVRIPARADTVINFASSGGNGITFTHTTGGEYITFSNLYVGSGYIGDGSNPLSGDSAMNAPVAISPGAGGHFFLNSTSSDGLTGYFRSHPQPSERLEQINEVIAQDHLAKDQPLKTFHIEYEITSGGK